MTRTIFRRLALLSTLANETQEGPALPPVQDKRQQQGRPHGGLA